jgi:acetolactate synthase I/II/III large subunit
MDNMDNMNHMTETNASATQNDHPELVVFLHAVGLDAASWQPQVAYFSKRYAVRSIEFVRPAPEVSIANFADDVAALIDAAGYARAHLVGLSMGGVVALEVFRRHRSKVRSLALANSWAWQAEGEGKLAWAEGCFASMSLPEFSQMSLPGLFAPGTDPAIVARGVAVESAKDPAMYQACWRHMLRADLRSVLPKIDVPTLLIGAALDQITPTQLLADIAAIVPCARLVELPLASHFSNLDCPDQFNATLQAHLRSARAAGSDQLTVSTKTLALPAASTAEQLLRLLWARGVELFASNSGTDFTPIIEALAVLEAEPAFQLRVIATPHENTAVAMAHGYALITRQPQAVMAHVGVGTANMGLGIINARRSRVPMLVLAGCTPWYEEGMAGVRTNFVQWGQDSFDQAAYFREFTKWDYELKGPNALDTVVERALAIAGSDPAGPVYLTLPKEALCMPAPARVVAGVARLQASHLGAAQESALRAAVALLKQAKAPLIVTADLGRHVGGAEALVAFSLAAGIGVIEHGKRNFFNFPTEHPHHLGFEPLPFVAEADLILALECPVPWIPAFAKLAKAPTVIQLGMDPLFSDIPMRGFPADVCLAGDPVATLRALATHFGQSEPSPLLAARHRQVFDAARSAARADAQHSRISKRFLSLTLGEVIDNEVIICNEYNLDPLLAPRQTPDSWFENSFASGLGWSLGAALGVKLAAPEKTVLVTLGDGSYLFNTPLSAQYTASAQSLPLLIVVFNDQAWSTIKKSTKGSHPQGVAVSKDQFALCDFTVPLDLDKIAEACGGIGLRVEHPAQLKATLQQALALVRSQTCHVLVNVLCERDG